MNIAFDATAILSQMSKNRGIGNYTLSQFKKIIELDHNNQYFFLNCFEEFRLDDVVGQANNLHETYFYCGRNAILLKDSEYHEVFGGIIKNFIREHKIDVFYVTSPFDESCCIYKKEWFAETNVVATVYDIIPFVMKEHYLRERTALRSYLQRVEMLKWMDRYLVISQSVKDDMVNHLHFDADKIDVIYGAADECFCQIDISNERKQEILSKYNISDPFIMCTGGEDERKNMEGLILAYSRLPGSLIETYQLVVVCKLSAEAEARFKTCIERNHVDGRVVLTNFVPNDELIILYNLAYLMAFPSKYEGFGLPVVEAWACGTPVLTSNNSSLGEIAGDAAIIVNPFDIDDITRGLTHALMHMDANALRKKGEERLKFFQWEVVAKLTIESLNKAFAPKVKEPCEKRSKLAVFAPLPPIQSGISDYSVDILNEISRYFDIDVFIDGGYQPDCRLNAEIHIFHHRKFRAKRYQNILYQMGNSYYHVYMYPYIMKYGGVLVLHDYNMHSVAYHVSIIKKKNPSLYRKYLLEDLSADEVSSYLGGLQNNTSSSGFGGIELNGFVVNYADKIIVHSDAAKEKLLRRDIGHNVKKIHSYAKIGPMIATAAARAKLGIEENAFVFSSFGHIHATKRSLPTLKAFHRLCMLNEYVHYFFVGLPHETIRKEMRNYIQENHLETRVTITGYIDLDEFERYIDATDVCVNLRYPSNGETSGSLMRILGKGKCVIVNAIDSFSEIPDDCCIKLPSVETMTDKQEVDAIFQTFEQLLHDRSLGETIGANARRFAEEKLDLRIIAEQYISFIKDDSVPTVTEETLRSIKKETQSNYYHREQLEQLAQTISYSRNAVPEEPNR